MKEINHENYHNFLKAFAEESTTNSIAYFKIMMMIVIEGEILRGDVINQKSVSFESSAKH